MGKLKNVLSSRRGLESFKISYEIYNNTFNWNGK